MARSSQSGSSVSVGANSMLTSSAGASVNSGTRASRCTDTSSAVCSSRNSVSTKSIARIPVKIISSAGSPSRRCRDHSRANWAE